MVLAGHPSGQRDTRQANERAWAVSHGSAYLARVRDAGTTPNGVFGSKLMWGYLDEFLLGLSHAASGTTDLALIKRAFPVPRVIWVRRRDIRAQAVSWAGAIQTGRWHHWDARSARGAAIYDRSQIDALVREIRRGDAGWRTWFVANGIRPREVSFERLVEDTVGVTTETLEFLGLDSRGAHIAAQTTRTRLDAIAGWLDRYRNEESTLD